MRRFILFLARTWFHCHPDELVEILDSQTITELAAEFSIEPWAEWRIDRGTAIVAAMVGNGAGGKKGGGSFSAVDFMPRWEELPEKSRRPKWQEDRDRFKAYTALRGGKINGVKATPQNRVELVKQLIREGKL